MSFAPINNSQTGLGSISSGSFGDIAGFYLPRPLRRWFIYLPLDVLGVLVVVAVLVFTRASLITADEFFHTNDVATDADLQFKHLSIFLRAGVAQGKLDIRAGYSDLCGYSPEWDPIFYAFYSMALHEVSETRPELLEDTKSQLSLCARGILRIPSDVSDNLLKDSLDTMIVGNSPIQAGYVGIVLGVRKIVAVDALYDIPLKRNAAALVRHLEENMEQTGAVWTSDQATQLYAIWLYDRATGENHSSLFKKWERFVKTRFTERGTGLLISEIGVDPDKAISVPRGSSVAWTVIFLCDVMPKFAREQYVALCRYREQRVVNLAATREFESMSPLQFGDADSGPLIGGFSPSATGFTLCAHKLCGDSAHFARVLRIFELFGAPRQDQGGKFYYRGNAMGDAILLYAKVARSRSEFTPQP